MSSQLSLKQCGIKYDPPVIVISYTLDSSNKLHRRSMPVRGFTKSSNIQKTAEDLRSHQRHGKYLSAMKLRQLEKLLTIIQDKMKGVPIQESMKKHKEQDIISPTEDLNKVDDETLARKKAVMEETFEKNRRKPGDDDFEYDIEVDFEQDPGPIETIEWDEDSDDDEF